jgi:endonuclease-3
MKKEERVLRVLRILSLETRRGRYEAAPVYRGPIEGQRTAFRTVVGCLISTRTRDEQTTRICGRLFAAAPTAEKLARLPEARLEKLLYGAGFYRQKAKQLKMLAQILVERGDVPRTREELMKLPGIGPKCANIVMASCFGVPVIAVDTHVHRISNRLGWVRSSTPEMTEQSLMILIPSRWRRRVNKMLVAHGQLVCKPIRPHCEECSISRLCKRRGVNLK